MLRTILDGDLQRRLGTLRLEHLLQFLVRTGTLTQATLDCGLFVVRYVSYGGRVVRGYGRSILDAIKTLSYGVWCAGGC